MFLVMVQVVSSSSMTQNKFNTDPRSPLISGLSKFRDDKAVQRWRHKLSVDWDFGSFGMTATNNFLSGYTDQNTPGLAAPEWNDRRPSPTRCGT
jgi:iron complex outermembrane receptor protein